MSLNPIYATPVASKAVRLDLQDRRNFTPLIKALFRSMLLPDSA
jgi:hypothetical protein